ncbi:MAG: hypothetical protein K9L68_05495 [Spirochaetales bacterium]|nr:hypothetical protein [Spirochaetales bacterium]MCF7938033.1 hypothetical protein [Spirochaetales bacterium]
MKRIFLVLMVAALAAGVTFAQEKRMYSDGEIDYAPMAAQFELFAEDDASSLKRIEYSIDGKDLRVYKQPLTFSTEGRHVIAYRAIDQSENVSKEKFYTVVIDDTAPDLTGSVNGPVMVEDQKVYLTSDTNIILRAEDELSGVDTVYVNLDGSGFVEFSDSAYIYEEGYHIGRAYAVDNVGNRSSTYRVEAYVDNTAPVVEINAEKDFLRQQGTTYSSKNNRYSVSAYDETAGVDEVLVSIDNREFSTYTGPFRIQEEGQHTIRARAVDKLGNVTKDVRMSFYVDSSEPDAGIRPLLDEGK